MSQTVKPQLRPLKSRKRLIVLGSTSAGLSNTDPRFDGVLLYGHIGFSMVPTLRPGDLLEVSPLNEEDVEPGDVILFRPPGKEELMVHRAIAVTPAGVRTQGDNNAYRDSHLLGRRDIVGLVIAARRGLHRRALTRGKLVQWQVKLTRRTHTLWRWFCTLLHPLYLALARSGSIRRLLPDHLQPRVVAFRAGGRCFFRLMIGRRLVGEYQERSLRWLIRSPFHLLINESTLPAMHDLSDQWHGIRYPLHSTDTHFPNQ